MDLGVVSLLLGAGLLVGVINTFAGAAAAITLTLFSVLGLPLSVANATNRIPVLFQTVTTSVVFYRQGRLDWRLGLRFSIPTVVGAVVGAELVSLVSDALFVWFLSVVLVVLMALLFFNPTQALRGKVQPKEPQVWHYMVLLAIGFYGGAFHVGVGYLFLLIFIGGLGYDFLSANALKGFVVLVYTVFSLVVFVKNGQIHWLYGLIHGVGNVVGAGLATRYADRIPVGVLRYSLMVFMGATIVYLFLKKL